MKKFLYALGTVVVLSVSVVAAFVVFLNTANFKPYVEKAVKEKTGRTLLINGDFDVQVASSPKIVMKNVNIANPEGAGAPYMATADSVEVTVSLLPLLKKELVVKEFVLQGMSLNLYTDKDGKNNWDLPETPLAEKEKDGAQDEKAVETEKEKGSFLKEIVLEKVAVNDVGFSYIDERTTEMYQLFLKSLSLQDNGENVHLGATAQILSKDITVTADIDDISKLLSSKEDVGFSVAVEGFDTLIELKGNVRDALNVGNVSASLNAKTDKLQQVASLFGVKMPALNDLTVSAKIAGTFKALSVPEFSASLGNQQTVLFDLKGAVENVFPLQNATASLAVNALNPAVFAKNGVTVAPFVLNADLSASTDSFAAKNVVFKGGETDFKGDFVVDASQKIFVKSVVESDVVSLNKLFLIIPVKQNNSSVQVIETAFVNKIAPTTVYSHEELPFDLLNKIDASVQINVKKFITANGADWGAVSFSAFMKDGVLQVPDFNLANVLFLKAGLNAAQKPATMDFSLRSDNLPLPALFLQSGVTNGNAKISIDLKTQGNSEHQMMENLNGDIFVFVKNPVFKNSFLAGLKTILPPVSEYENRTEVPADCVVVNVPVVNGMIVSDQQMALQSADFDVQVNGEINLGNEKLRLNIVTGMTGSNVLNAISGTLTITGDMISPRAEFDAENAMNKALSAGMAYLFSGKQAVKEYLSSPVPANACEIAVAGGTEAYRKDMAKKAKPAPKKRKTRRVKR